MANKPLNPMDNNAIFKTNRLIFREFQLSDAPFILELVNTAEWIQYIGDRNIKSTADAENYLINGPMKSYQYNGFGLWLAIKNDTQLPLGMCGFLKRETLDHPDIGFALMPQYAGKGFGFEMAQATLNYGRNEFKFQTVLGITSPTNERSIGLLTKIGLQPKGPVVYDETKESLLFRIDFSTTTE